MTAVAGIWRVLALAMLMLAGSASAAGLYEARIPVFGSWVDLSLWNVEPATAETAKRVVAGDMGELHTRWHAWEPGALTAINERIANGEPAPIEPHLAPILRRAQELSLASGDLFNPAIGRLVGLWGFHARNHRRPPPAEQIAVLVAAAPSMADLQIEDRLVTSANPAVQIDLGAFAKGYGVDIAIGRLRELGINHAVVNAGGDLRAIGRRGDRPWRIGIQDPFGDAHLASLEIEGDESVFTSGTYQRHFVYQGVRYHHIIDPRTGYPARGAVSVTVIGQSGAQADAAATALLVAGPAEWPGVARDLGIRHVLLVAEDGTLHASAAMAARLRFEQQPTPEMQITRLE